MAYAALRAEIAAIEADPVAYLLGLTSGELTALAALAEEAADDSEAETIRADAGEALAATRTTERDAAIAATATVTGERDAARAVVDSLHRDLGQPRIRRVVRR